MTCARVNQVPREVWEPVAQAVAFVHGITVKQMLYEGRAYKYTIPRARFWYVLRSFIPRYTLTAIGNITGHDHSTVVTALQGGAYEARGLKIKEPKRLKTKHPRAHLDYDALVAAATRRRRDLTGEVHGYLTVLGPAPRPPGKTHYRWWLCRCTCGQEVAVDSGSLGHDSRQACGVNGHRFKNPNRVTRHKGAR
jgi:hypothetical protein